LRAIWDILDIMLTVFVFDQSIKKNTRHGYRATGEEWVIVHSVLNFDTGGGVDVASEKGEYVIL